MTFKRLHIGFDIDLESLLRSASDVRVDVYREEPSHVTTTPRRLAARAPQRLGPPRNVTPEGIRTLMLRHIVNKGAPVTRIELRDLTMARGYSKNSHSSQLSQLKSDRLIKRLKDGTYIHTERAIVELANREAASNGE